MVKSMFPEWTKAVKMALLERGMSIIELSNQLNYSRAYVTNVVNGKYNSPEMRKLISDYLGIPFS